MLKRIVSGIMLAALLTSMLILEFNIQQAKAEPKTWTVDDDGPADFSKIQDAINAASLGDTICVRNGTYYENVVVNKALTLIGENKESAIIDGNGTGTVVTSVADYVNVSGFAIRNGEKDGVRLDIFGHNNISDNNVTGNGWNGIYLNYSDYNTINSNYVTDNGLSDLFYSGIYLESSWGNTIIGNTITAKINSDDGIHLIDSHNSTIIGNTITSCSRYGAFFEHSDNNTVGGNTITHQSSEGIYLYDSINNTVSGNNASNNGEYGIICGGYNNKVSGNNANNNSYGGILVGVNSTVSGNNVNNNKYYGIYIPGDNNTVSGNSLNNNGYAGICTYIGEQNRISSNEVNNNYYGIYLRSNNNTVLGNIVNNNAYGICVEAARNNSIYHNNFINNRIQASVSLLYVNSWDNGYPSGGNYWSNYTGVDLYKGSYQNQTGSDGIGDAPYIIDAYNKDNYPLMQPTNISLYVAPSPVEFWTPAYSKTFTVDVKIATVANLYGFEFKLYWNTTLLDLVSANITPPSVWGTNYFVGMNDTREDLGRYWLAVAALSPASSFNGSATLAKLTFKITYDPIYPNNVTASLDIADTELSDLEANPIPHDTYDGGYNCYSTKPKLGMAPSTYTAKILGEVFTVNITVADVVGLYSFEFQLSYNSSFLDATEVTLGPFLKSPYRIKKQIIDDDAGVVWFSVESQSPAQSAYGSGMLATIKFRVQNESGVWCKGFVPLECDLNLSGTILKTNEGVLIPHDILNPLVHFAYTPIPGDLNSDGTVNIFDLRIVARAFGSVPGDLSWDLRADLNRDDEINVYDIVLVSKNYGRTTP